MPEIDLSQLPAPEVVEPLDYEAILAEITADYIGRYPEHTAFVESDPSAKLLETAAYREMLLRWRINEAAKQNMLAFARGTNLDHLVALTGVQRQDGESDERLLRRFRLSLQALSVAGPRGAYEFHALSADPRVRSVAITTPKPGDVRLVVVGGDNADGLPPAALLTKVEDALDDALKRPLTDTVRVLAARNVCYQVAVTIHIDEGPDRELAKAAAESAILAYLLAQHPVGAIVYKSAIVSAAHVPGVSHASVEFSWDAGSIYTALKLDIADLSTLPAAWRRASAFWPARPVSVDGTTTKLGRAIRGYKHPATAPADGLTVTLG